MMGQLSADFLLPSAPPRRWRLGRDALMLERPAGLMGIVNVTPDSFSDGGIAAVPQQAVAHARQLVAGGASWLDIGGESSRPGARPIGVDEELNRVIPALTAIHAALPRTPLSVDTTKAAVAKAAIAAGADLVNDISAGSDPEMLPLIASRAAAVVLMHMQGSPQTMQRAPRYDDVVDEVIAFLERRMNAAREAGVAEDSIVLDPGIGFGKTVEHNLQLLRALPRIADAFARPLVVGISRKSFLGAISGIDEPADHRDHASHIVHAALAPWCALLRVHDVAGALAACRIAANLRGA
jgi:dihydropteroate synthase